jgi:uncharacterized membrane protein
MQLKYMLKYLFVVFYLLAGINHFLNPSLYLPLIPDYLHNYKYAINVVSGLAELLVAFLMLFKSTTKLAAYLTIAMLIAFVPSHIYFIQKGNLPIGSFIITPIIAWVRLLIIHPLLIYWAWWLAR